jgi:CO/xanthine dehydrogenase Mo-binding subunit
MLGMPIEKVRMQHVQGSGCYGHNMADDAAADAALLAVQVPGQSVRLQYSREQEHAWEPYGSAMVIKTQASLDAQGNVLDWDYTLWSTPHGTRPSGEPGNLLSAAYLEKPFAMPKPINGGGPNYAADRNAIALYDFPGHNVTTHFITEMPWRVSSTRGLGAYANVFAIESFIDELAHAAQQDPLAFRLAALQHAPRHRAVLQAAAQRRVIVVDGFIASAAVLVAQALQPLVLQRCVFAHRSGERGHSLMLNALKVEPWLDLQLRLGEGSGAALAWPLLQSACAILREMASFASAGVSEKTVSVVA